MTEQPEQPLKERLDNGALVYIQNAKGEKIASAYREDPFYVMVGATGKHNLDIDNTPADRLETHWEGFMAACLNHQPTLADTFLDRWNKETVAVPTLAKELDPAVTITFPNIIGYKRSARRYTFADRSAILTFGRGRSHQIRKENPKCP